ncbi:MAG: ABC-ATPase domain-containing protein [Syntrophomonadaceae bacterium]|nr:ABC-ATPase domain-containing protein [Syntrophomonadaceae bacterium]
MLSKSDLSARLNQLDGKGYKAYQSVKGKYDMDKFILAIDHVQGDPFASPSRARLRLPLTSTGMPSYLFENPDRRVALADIIARQFNQAIRSLAKGNRGTGKSGMVYIDSGGQEVLPRTAVKVDNEFLELRVSIGLPAAGRTILGREARAMLLDELPTLLENTLYRVRTNEREVREHVLLYEDQNYLRGRLAPNGIVAFIGNGSILPRRSGVSDLPLERGRAIPLVAPPELEVEMETWHHGTLRGMGVPLGVTLIVGGGYHGKTTLLKAVERGVYNHIKGDGREWVITVATAAKIRAEDGRYVERVNIRPFIDNLPFGQDTGAFSSENASGSTSQAANIMEAVEAGAELLLLDEDTSATNFMLRDARMQKLVAKEKEPITPFIDRVGQLYTEKGVSTVIVMGGAGDYFDVCDTVIMMENYRPREVTHEAKLIARQFPSFRQEEATSRLETGPGRVPLTESFNPFRGHKLKTEARGLDTVVFGNSTIDLGLVEQLVDPSQTRAIAELIHYAVRYVDGKRSLREILELVYRDIAAGGLEVISPFQGQHPGDLAYPRLLEAAAAINRLRTLRVK